MTIERMTLRTTLTSPFGRKVRMAAEILGLTKTISIVTADTLDESDSLRRQNPLGKMPCLILTDGTILFDSKVIVEYLRSLVDDHRLVPEEGPKRFRTLTRATLFDGITEAALLMVYEGRFRDPGQISERWLAHQRGKVLRGLTAAAADLPDPASSDIASIGLACALGYLDWRRPVQWRQNFTGIVEWLEAFSESEPALTATQMPMESAA